MSAATAKKSPAKAEAKTPVKTEAKTKVAETKVPNKGPYRSAPEFLPALKSAKSLAKGTPMLKGALQLLTHLAWKKSSETVSWTAGTTSDVPAFADDIAVPVGTPIAEAIAATLAVAVKAVETDAQRDALGVLSEVIKAHEAA